MMFKIWLYLSCLIGPLLITGCSNSELLLKLVGLPEDSEQQIILEVQPYGRDRPTQTLALKRKMGYGSSRNTLVIDRNDLGDDIVDGSLFSLTIHIIDSDGCSSQCGRLQEVWHDNIAWVPHRELTLQPITSPDCTLQGSELGQSNQLSLAGFDFIAAAPGPEPQSAWLIGGSSTFGAFFYFDGKSTSISNIAPPRASSAQPATVQLTNLNEGTPQLRALSGTFQRAWAIAKTGEIFYFDKQRLCKHKDKITENKENVNHISATNDKVLFVGDALDPELQPAIWYCEQECTRPEAIRKIATRGIGKSALVASWLGELPWVGNSEQIFKMAPSTSMPGWYEPQASSMLFDAIPGQAIVSMFPYPDDDRGDPPGLLIRNYTILARISKTNNYITIAGGDTSDCPFKMGGFVAGWLSKKQSAWILNGGGFSCNYDIMSRGFRRVDFEKPDDVLTSGLTVDNDHFSDYAFGKAGVIYGYPQVIDGPMAQKWIRLPRSDNR